jgi:uncharacterized protein (TIGR03435 family)
MNLPLSGRTPHDRRAEPWDAEPWDAERMRAFLAVTPLLFWHCASFAQTFDVASVKPSRRTLGRDANSPVTLGATGLNGRNVTLKRLIVEAYNLQPHQVSGGPKWLDDNEYDIDAKADGPATKETLRMMLRTLLADRFRLSVHSENRELHVYELVIDKAGPKIHPATDPESFAAKTGPAGPPNFRGTLQQFANMLSVQLTIPEINDPGRPSIASGAPVPVLDKTGLAGLYDIPVDMRPEVGADMFTLWQRALQNQLGLKLESRKSKVDVLVVDRAEKIPAAN